MPACLIKILLLIAGIESNPGPLSYYCPVCHQRLLKNSTSVICYKCNEWVHVRKKNNCSNLPSTKAHNKSYICPACISDPLQTPITPSTNQIPSQPITTPPPPPPPNTPLPARTTNHDNNNINYNLKILQWNCCGIQNKLTELTSFVNEHNIKIIVLQETKLTNKSKTPEIPNFVLVRKDRKRDTGGGLAIFIHSSIIFQEYDPFPDNQYIESQAIKIGDIILANIYIPPASSCPGPPPVITPYLLQEDSLILGDFNSHDSLWHSPIFDSRGRDIAEEINNSNHGVLNEESFTRIPTNGQPTSPDISLASLSLLPYTKWETMINLSSDHVPIIISISTSLKTNRCHKRTYVNFKKADWNRFQSETEDDFSNLPEPTNIHKSEKVFRKIINNASKRCIPAGRIRDIIPEIPTATKEKIDKRDELRSTTPDHPEIPNINREIYQEINTHRSNKWKETIENLGNSCSSKLFKLIKNLSSKETSNPNQAIRFKGKYFSTAKDISNQFNKQYSSIVHHKSSKETRRIYKDIHKNTLEDNIQLTQDKTKEAIKKSKASKAIGPDGISNLHLKNLGNNGIMYLTKIFNLSVKESTIPDIWKSSIIIPLLKPGKKAEESNSYRPVSLLCPSIKILERLLIPTLNEHLVIPSHQHGFRQQHSTVTALNEFNIQVSTGFNKKRPPERTVLLQIDLSKAFDMVSHDKLLKDLNNTSLPGSLKRWFTCYLRGRQCRTRFRNSLSSSRNIRTGVPQGAVTSPILFNFYLTNLPKPPEGVKVVQYADDISIYATGKDIPALTVAINGYAKRVSEYLKERELLVSPEKSTVTLFTPDTKEYKIHPQVQLDGKVVDLCHTPKLLGVTFDTMYTFSPHVNISTDKAKSKVNLLKMVAGSDWGQNKEIIETTYKAIGRSLLEYAIPIWSPIISKTSWSKLQTIQNQAMRIATGCHAMSPIDHLHRETKMLPVKDHGDLLTKQFLLNCYLPGHPGNKFSDTPANQRNLKPNILKLRDEIQEYLPITDKKNLRQKMTSIHTKAVNDTINNYAPSKVLDCTPPSVHNSEKELSRNARTKLSQLRSGYSRLLNSYNNRIDENIPNICPNCGATPHDTNHLFNCRSNPTELTVFSLWTRPKLAAEFLKLDDNGVT